MTNVQRGKVKRLLTIAGLSWSQIATQCGVTVDDVRKVAGRKPPKSATARTRIRRKGKPVDGKKDPRQAVVDAARECKAALEAPEWEQNVNLELEMIDEGEEGGEEK